jgi:hypothetical protein
MWDIALTKRALKDAKKINNSSLRNKVEKLIEILKLTFRTSLCKMIKVLKPSNLFWTKYK